MSKSKVRIVGWAVLAVATSMLLSFAVAYYALLHKGFFDPQFEEVRRTTFETSKAYRDGMAQELRSMQFEYLKSDAEHRKVLASVIRHKLAGFPADALPADLQQFVKELP